jgi:hypothetical protein
MGSNRTRTFCLILVLAAVAFSEGCRRKAPSRLSGADVGEPRGALGVVYAGPRGEIAAPPEAEEIVVVFDHPMAPLSDRSEDRTLRRRDIPLDGNAGDLLPSPIATALRHRV